MCSRKLFGTIFFAACISDLQLPVKDVFLVDYKGKQATPPSPISIQLLYFLLSHSCQLLSSLPFSLAADESLFSQGRI